MSVTPSQCPGCGSVPEPDHLFCEKCGFDFITSTAAEAPEVEVEVAAAEPGAVSPPSTVVVSVDPQHHAFIDPDGQLELPDPVPEPTQVTLAPASLVGRRSDSRAVYPEVDVAALTGDPAVSARQAMLRRRDDGSWVISDLESTNGTYLRRPGTQPVMLDPGIEVPVEPDATILVGAWTALRLT
ncbi:MAG: FHA domain-containing protein [Acidimicrobiales bacterium]